MNNNVKELRLKKKLSQMAFGDVIDLPQSYVSMIERGKISLSPTMAKRIAKAFGVSVKSLMRD